MKVFIFGLFVVAASATFLESGKFQVFKSNHGKTYKNQVEETKRFNIFNENLRAIEEHNALYDVGLVSYKKAVNKFTDLTQEEFEDYLKTRASNKPKLNAILFAKTEATVPESVDWRTSGQLTHVKNQKGCEGCWSFSLTGAAEAAYFRKTGKLVSFSEQQLLDCAPKPNQGCRGGLLDETYPYLEEFGYQSAESYPFIERTSTCKYNTSEVVTKPSGHVVIKKEDEDGLREAVGTVGPVSIAVNAKYLSPYSSGIFSELRCDPKGINHAVLVVGYGSENGKDYWIVKNSWGAEWGENGYFRIARGINMCGVAEDCVYPIID